MDRRMHDIGYQRAVVNTSKLIWEKVSATVTNRDLDEKTTLPYNSTGRQDGYLYDVTAQYPNDLNRIAILPEQFTQIDDTILNSDILIDFDKDVLPDSKDVGTSSFKYEEKFKELDLNKSKVEKSNYTFHHINLYYKLKCVNTCSRCHKLFFPRLQAKLGDKYFPIILLIIET